MTQKWNNHTFAIQYHIVVNKSIKSILFADRIIINVWPYNIMTYERTTNYRYVDTIGMMDTCFIKDIQLLKY